MEYTIRKAIREDLPRIEDIYAYARQFMAETGNPHQWGKTTPQTSQLEDDIQKGLLFVLTCENIIHGVFYFYIGADPTYGIIEDGCWRSETSYGTIHRIAGDGSGAHMGLVTQHRVTHIVIVGGLHIVKEDDIFKLAGVAHNGLFAHNGAAADEGAVAYLRLMVNDAGRAYIGRGENRGILGDPHAITGIVVFIGRKRGAQFKDESLYIIQNLPGIGLTLKKRGSNAVAEVQQIFYFYHITSPL